MAKGSESVRIQGEQERREPTNGGVLEDDQEAGIIDPLDLESSINAFPFGKGGLNIPSFELFRESSERKDACDAGRELGERGSHG